MSFCDLRHLLGVDCGAVAPIEGLYINFAVICEKVLREADDVLSFIRIVDQVNVTIVTPPGVDVPPELPQASSVPLTFAVGLKSAGYTGPWPSSFGSRPQRGQGCRSSKRRADSAADRGVNLIFPMQLPVQTRGFTGLW